MKIAQVQFAPWDKIYKFHLPEDVLATLADFVIVDTESGEELAKIIKIDQGENTSVKSLKPVLRLASVEDAQLVYDSERKQKALSVCQSLIEKHDLKMRLIDARFSFTGNKLTFAFSAEARIDFRTLVKDLHSALNLNIRLFQVGSRDQARFQGDCGPCGLGLCCRSFVRDFSSITSEMAEVQQVVHRGSDRISGMCGRLMCCLNFEYEAYQNLSEDMPAIGSKIKINGRVGRVVAHHLLKQIIDVRFDSDKQGEKGLFLQVSLKQLKKSKKFPNILK